jgi:hypothetical protein
MSSKGRRSSRPAGWRAESCGGVLSRPLSSGHRDSSRAASNVWSSIPSSRLPYSNPPWDGWVAGFMGANKWNRSGGMAAEHLKVGTEQANALKSGNATEMRRHWTLTTRGGPLPRRQENTRLDVSPFFHVHPKNRRLAAGCNTMNWHGMESLVPLDMTGLPIRASASGFGIAFGTQPGTSMNPMVG